MAGRRGAAEPARLGIQPQHGARLLRYGPGRRSRCPSLAVEAMAQRSRCLPTPVCDRCRVRDRQPPAAGRGSGKAWLGQQHGRHTRRPGDSPPGEPPAGQTRSHQRLQWIGRGLEQPTDIILVCPEVPRGTGCDRPGDGNGVPGHRGCVGGYRQAQPARRHRAVGRLGTPGWLGAVGAVPKNARVLARVVVVHPSLGLQPGLGGCSAGAGDHAGPPAAPRRGRQPQRHLVPVAPVGRPQPGGAPPGCRLVGPAFLRSSPAPRCVPLGLCIYLPPPGRRPQMPTG